MQNAVNYARGTIRFEINGAFPERFLNLCAEHRVEFWQLERVDAATLRLSIHWRQRRRLTKMAQTAGFTIRRVGQAGGPVLWDQLRRRLGLVVGAGLFAALVYSMSLFVWDIEVVGNESIPAEEILLHLQELGVGVGAPAGRFQSAALRDEMMLRIERLSWLGVNVKGSRATVEVRERTEGQPIVDKKTPAHIRAAKAGVIVEMKVLEGHSVATVGMSVNAGDVIVSGEIVNEHGVTRLVHARAEIKARTWYTIEAAMPLTAQGKHYTGKTARRCTLVLGSSAAIDAGPRAPYPFFDLTRREQQLTLPPEVRTPLKLVTYEYAQYLPAPYTVSLPVARASLEKALHRQLDALAEGAEITSQNIEYRQEGNYLIAAMTAECLEEIAAEETFMPGLGLEPEGEEA